MRQVDKFTTQDGRTIYRFPVQAFPPLAAFIHVISDGNEVILVDCGSGLEESNNHLVAGFAAIGEQHGETISLADVSKILITHGHMDHFGGLSFVRQHTAAPIGIHPLDVRVLSHYEERRLVAARRLEIFLEQAGVKADARSNLMTMYLYAKDVYKSTAVQFTLDEAEPVSDIDVYHVPGHCPGQVCLKVDDVMLTADHILARITPHQAPEDITLNTGLGHYLDSLEKISGVAGVRLGLGGHEEAISDIYARIAAIKAFHMSRLDRVLEICQEPKNVTEISRELFGEQHHYHILLALEEAGAHVEYLYQRGHLVAANVAEIAEVTHPVIQYQRV